MDNGIQALKKIVEKQTRQSKEYQKACQIKKLKEELQETDYKVIKSAEYMLAGLPPPYDIAALNKQRQAIRDKINELEMQ